MDILSVHHQKKRVTVAALAGAVLFILAPILTAWLSPYNARATEQEPSSGAAAVRASAPELPRPLAEAGKLAAADLNIDGQALAAKAVGSWSAAALAQTQPANTNAGGTAGAPGANAALSTIPADTAAAVNEVANTPVGGAVTGFWSLAWSKAWPPIRNILLKLWAIVKGVVLALWSVVKDSGDVNADVNAAVNMPLNGAASSPPVNGAP